MKRTWIALGLCLSVVAAGCSSSEKAEIKEDRLTVGKVQGEIKVGMPASQVAELLGSPNIVTTDDKRREVWIYDKVSTDRVDVANSSFAGIILILGTRSSESSSSAAATHPHHHHQVRRREEGPRLCLQLHAVLASAAVPDCGERSWRGTCLLPFKPARRVCHTYPAGRTLSAHGGESAQQGHADPLLRDQG